MATSFGSPHVPCDRNCTEFVVDAACEVHGVVAFLRALCESVEADQAAAADASADSDTEGCAS